MIRIQDLSGVGTSDHKGLQLKAQEAPYKEQDEIGWLRLIKIRVQPQTLSVISPHSVCMAEEGVEEKHLETL